MTNEHRVPLTDSNAAIEEPRAPASLAQRRELREGKTWKENRCAVRRVHAGRNCSRSTGATATGTRMAGLRTVLLTAADTALTSPGDPHG